jgi:hypothetical protein
MLEALQHYPNLFPELKVIPILKYYRENLQSQYLKEMEVAYYHRFMVCVDCSVYPLAWIWYTIILWVLEFNHFIQGKVYFFLLWTLEGKEFIPGNEIVGGWKRMLSLYFKYRKENANTNY